MEYRGHMINAHKWYCPSCETKNSGLSFPKCEMCGNILSEDGEDAVDAMIKHANKIDRYLEKFLKRDLAYYEPNYNLHDRLLQVNLLIRDDNENCRKLDEELSRSEDMSQRSGKSVVRIPPEIITKFPIIVKKKDLALEELKKKTLDAKL
jgi:hypothetical protein